jgi:hypothetical protein
MHGTKQSVMKGLGLWIWAPDRAQPVCPKLPRKKSSQGKSLLSKKEQLSGFGESAAARFIKSDLTSFGDEPSESDNDPAVVRTVETLSVFGSDVSTRAQEKEARSSGGIPFR